MSTIKLTKEEAQKLGLSSTKKQKGFAGSGASRMYTMNGRGTGNYRFDGETTKVRVVRK